MTEEWIYRDVGDAQCFLGKMRLAQASCQLDIQRVTVAITIDLTDLHSPNGSAHNRLKRIVAQRAAFNALALDYSGLPQPPLPPSPSPSASHYSCAHYPSFLDLSLYSHEFSFVQFLMGRCPLMLQASILEHSVPLMQLESTQAMTAMASVNMFRI
eukprot:SAG31_NODE_381_length_16458_cov_18.069259_12_plen_156_part_00